MVTDRKFKTMAAAQFVWVGLFVWGGLSEPGFLSLTNLTIGGYFLANVAHKKVSNGKVRSEGNDQS